MNAIVLAKSERLAAFGGGGKAPERSETWFPNTFMVAGFAVYSTTP
jgi:hypothetical protein